MCFPENTTRRHFYAFNRLLSVYYNVLPPPPEIQHDNASTLMKWPMQTAANLTHPFAVELQVES